MKREGSDYEGYGDIWKYPRFQWKLQIKGGIKEAVQGIAW